MAVPKKKVSKARRNSRKANWKLDNPSYAKCSQCHEIRANHTVCKKCGYYKGRQVIAVKGE
ncbi:MAG: 50S ribosomal protein L32 [Firmicutes bacterium]|nr:50S ribosomal protein L32 [Bacillota bacterium]